MTNYKRDAIEQAREQVLDDYANKYITADELVAFVDFTDAPEYLDRCQHEWADGHPWLVYTYKQRDLLAAGVLDEYFEEAEEFVTVVESPRPADIHFQFLAAAVYLFLRDCYRLGAVEALHAIAEVDGGPALVWQAERYSGRVAI